MYDLTEPFHSDVGLADLPGTARAGYLDTFRHELELSVGLRLCTPGMPSSTLSRDRSSRPAWNRSKTDRGHPGLQEDERVDAFDDLA